MTVPDELLRPDAAQAFAAIPDESLDSSFRSLLATFRTAATGGGRGTATEAGLAAIPSLLAAIPDTPAGRLPHLILLLGLLADTDEGNEPVGAGLDQVLPLLARAGKDRRLVAAWLYLTGLFPAERDRVLAAAEAITLSPDDASRLERSLAPGMPEQPVLARVWPSPASWAITDAEIQADARWQAVTPAKMLQGMWDGDTRAIRDYTGAKAVALLDGGAEPYRAEPDYTDPEDPYDVGGPNQLPFTDQAGTQAGTQVGTQADSQTSRLAPHEAALACPDCFAPLGLSADGARCEPCDNTHPAFPGWLDLSSTAGYGEQALILNDVAQVPRYERSLRPAFLRVMGRDFDNELTIPDEKAFLLEQVQPVDGPVLDVACGAGLFTRMLVERFGTGRVVALDLSTSMLSALQAAGTPLPAIRGSAINLPLAESSAGAVNCWNALQTLPDAGQVIAEAGRVLRPGGTFTLFTFLPDPDELYREFQARQERATRVRLYPAEQLRQWVAAAGLTVRVESGVGDYLFLAAVKETDG